MHLYPWPRLGERADGSMATVRGDMLCGATAVRARTAVRAAPRGATAACGLRVCAWPIETRGDTACTDACGMWHGGIAGSRVRRGGGV